MKHISDAKLKQRLPRLLLTITAAAALFSISPALPAQAASGGPGAVARPSTNGVEI